MICKSKENVKTLTSPWSSQEKHALKFLIRDNIVFFDRDFDPVTGISFCFSEQEAVGIASVLVVGLPVRHLLASDS